MQSSLELIYIDNHLIVVNKPAGLLIQGDKTGDPTLFNSVQRYLKEAFNKPGNVYLGLIHRIDRPVSGTVVFARTSKAASRLSEQFRKKTTKKIYRALVKGKTPTDAVLKDQIERKGSSSFIAAKDGGKPAIMAFKRLLFKKGLSLLEIELETGRHHQIRVQLANQGFPILGDFRYGSKEKFPQKSIALHAYSIKIEHPVQKTPMTFQSIPSLHWPFFNIKGDQRYPGI